GVDAQLVVPSHHLIQQFQIALYAARFPGAGMHRHTHNIGTPGFNYFKVFFGKAFEVIKSWGANVERVPVHPSAWKARTTLAPQDLITSKCFLVKRLSLASLSGSAMFTPRNT